MLQFLQPSKQVVAVKRACESSLLKSEVAAMSHTKAVTLVEIDSS